MSETTTPSWIAGVGAEADMTGDASERKTFRVWMPAGSEKEFVFITDITEAPVIWEHSYQSRRNGKLSWGNFLTCLKSIGQPCPMCQFAEEYGKFRRYKGQFFSVIDLTPWENKKTGKTIPYSRRVLMVKSRMQEKIVRRALNLQDKGLKLTGAKFLIARSKDDKSPSTGDDFDYVDQVDLATFPEDVRKGLDLNEFAPDPKKMAEVVQSLRVAHGDSMPATSSTLYAPASTVTGGPIEDDTELPPAVEIDYE